MVLILVAACPVAAQEATVRGTVTVVHPAKNERSSGEVVVWLTPTRGDQTVAPGPTAQLLQKNKRFMPHLLVITVGTHVAFPNEDPFFHNVFSIYRGKPFDLGLYESGSSKSLRFSQPGVSYIYCNIHPKMSAVVLVLKTRHFATSKENGTFEIAKVPPGRYRMEVWYERAKESDLAAMMREVDITAGDNKLPAVTIQATAAPIEHLNKYGQPYEKEKHHKY